ncbi:MAG: HAMP domain-containing protein [Desulforudis sp.]|nr:MAG: HAMP domain-containing protein [Desulforudis sp.]
MAESKKSSMSIRYKLGALFLVILTLFSVVVLFTVTRLIVDGAEDAALVKAKGDLATGREIIEQRIPGAWRVDGENLYKGTVLMNGNYAIVDYIGELTGDTVTVFLGDTRITTNVKLGDGSRAVGTKVSDAVAETVLKKGQPYYGEANVVGTMYQTAYEPIKDASGQVIGIWYVGAPKDFVDAMIRDTYLNVVVTALVLMVLSLLAWVFFSNRILIRPLKAVATAAGRLTEGDLKQRVPVKNRDEINLVAMAFNELAEKLDGLITSVQDSAMQLASHSEEISASSEHVSAAIQNLTSTTSEMAASAQQGSSSVVQAAEAARAAEAAAEGGRQAAQQAINKMSAIQATVNSSAQSVQTLNEQSAKIGQIIQVINDIADQTNLLALNAAIEAARAGEHGRGFAVVAEEVRKLAEKSSQATKEIEQIVKAIQGDTAKAVESMKAGAGEVSEGSQIIKKAGQALDNITESAKTSTELAGEIAQMTEQNAQGVQSLAASSEEVSSTVQQMAAAANELAKMADDLNALVLEIKRQ